MKGSLEGSLDAIVAIVSNQISAPHKQIKKQIINRQSCHQPMDNRYYSSNILKPTTILVIWYKKYGKHFSISGILLAISYKKLMLILFYIYFLYPKILVINLKISKFDLQSQLKPLLFSFAIS